MSIFFESQFWWPSFAVFFFPRENRPSFRENFCSCFREKSKVCVNKIQKVHVKNPKCPWKFWKNFFREIRFLDLKKKQKLHSWKPKSGREKSGKSLWMYLFLQTFFNFVTILFGIHRLLYYWFEVLCVKIKTFAWKNSFLLAWKLKANTWNIKKKSTWKNHIVREISEKSIREKRLPHVKKMKKWPKKRFTHTFFFT